MMSGTSPKRWADAPFLLSESSHAEFNHFAQEERRQGQVRNRGLTAASKPEEIPKKIHLRLVFLRGVVYFSSGNDFIEKAPLNII